MQPLKYKFGNRSHSSSLSNSPRLGEPESMFTFSNTRPTNSVSVEGIPDHVDKREIVSLFKTLIGDVRSSQEIKDGPASRLDITFFDRDAATKALCMNGYTVDGVPLTVSALTMSSPGTRHPKYTTDDRRNLYVLGLPFALNKNEFAAVFSQHGVVSHCVILATVDNSSRRRGFIVMSSHEEAKVAMSALTRTQIKGHTIDVSWAVVQRSQGFLDGGDRALILDSRAHLASPGPRLNEISGLASSDTSESSLGSHGADNGALLACSLPTTALFVSNLPTILFSQAQDLHPLFFPFGHIDKLEIVQVSPAGSMSVVVQYTSAMATQEAKESLNGQVYGSFQIEAHYVRPSNSGLLNAAQTLLVPRPFPLERRTTDPFPGSSNSYAHRAKSSAFLPTSPALVNLNGTDRVIGTASRLNTHSLSFNTFSNLEPKQTILSASHPAYPNLYQTSNDSRPTSASSRWSIEQPCVQPMRDHPLQYAAHSNAMHFDTIYQSSAA